MLLLTNFFFNTLTLTLTLTHTLPLHTYTHTPPTHTHTHTHSSEVLANRAKPTVTDSIAWIGNKFVKPTEPTTSKSHVKFAFKKSIIPTKNIFQVGLHVHGACHLQYPYSGCEENHTGFCYKPSRKTNSSGKFSRTHSFIDQLKTREVKAIDTQSQGVLYHIMIFRDVIPANITDSTANNDYTVKYFPDTLAALKKRGYEALFSVPKTVKKAVSVADSWADYDLVYNSRKTYGTLFPGFGKVILTVPVSAIKTELK